MSFLLNEGGESDNAAIRLSTRENRWIKNQRRLEWPREALAEDLRKCRESYPDIIVRSVTAVYNCVGMVFGARRTWIDPDQVPMILKDDNYRRLPGLFEQVQIGDIVIYRSDDGEIAHIGMICERHDDFATATIAVKVLSKWGVWAEVIHAPEYVLPSFGKPVEVWTDRKDVK